MFESVLNTSLKFTDKKIPSNDGARRNHNWMAAAHRLLCRNETNMLQILVIKAIYSFNRDLNQGCLVYMFSLRFSGSNFFEKFTAVISCT